MIALRNLTDPIIPIPETSPIAVPCYSDPSPWHNPLARWSWPKIHLASAADQLRYLDGRRIRYHGFAIDETFGIASGVGKKDGTATGGLKTSHIAAILSGHVYGAVEYYPRGSSPRRPPGRKADPENSSNFCRMPIGIQTWNEEQRIGQPGQTRIFEIETRSDFGHGPRSTERLPALKMMTREPADESQIEVVTSCRCIASIAGSCAGKKNAALHPFSADHRKSTENYKQPNHILSDRHCPRAPPATRYFFLPSQATWQQKRYRIEWVEIINPRSGDVLSEQARSVRDPCLQIVLVGPEPVSPRRRHWCKILPDGPRVWEQKM